MVLGFKEIFVDKILSGSKIHTIREDKHNRWKPGKKIHFATGVRTKSYKQFYEGICTGTQTIHISREDSYGRTYVFISIDGKVPLQVNNGQVQQLAKNDGFVNLRHFLDWFDVEDFQGKIIHWTKFRY